MRLDRFDPRHRAVAQALDASGTGVRVQGGTATCKHVEAPAMLVFGEMLADSGYGDAPIASEIGKGFDLTGPIPELTLGHLRYHLTDVPPQPNSPPDYVFRTDQLPKEATLNQKLT